MELIPDLYRLTPILHGPVLPFLPFKVDLTFGI